jgi:hypothetical protein
MFVLLWQWLKRFAMDPTFAAARLRALLTAVAGTSFLGSAELAEAIGNPAAVRWFRIAGLVLGVVAASVKAGEANDQGEVIAEKLRAEGYLVTKMEPTATPPPGAQP